MPALPSHFSTRPRRPVNASPIRPAEGSQGEVMSWNANTIRSAKRASTGRFTFFPLLLFVALVATRSGQTQTAATDPGVRGGPAGAGRPIAGVDARPKSLFHTRRAELTQ